MIEIESAWVRDGIHAMWNPLHKSLVKHAAHLAENPRIERANPVWQPPNVHRRHWRRGLMITYKPWPPGDNMPALIRETMGIHGIAQRIMRDLGISSYDITWHPLDDQSCLVLWDEPLWMS